MKSFKKEDIVDLTDVALAAELAPGVEFPLSEEKLGYDGCVALDKAILARTQRTIDSIIENPRNNQLIALILTGSDYANDGEDSLEWALARGIHADEISLGTWGYSHDGSRQNALRTLLEEGGVQVDG